MKKQAIKTITCPVCHGRRKIRVPFRLRGKLDTNSKRAIAKILRKNSFSIREIGKFLNVKSPAAVQFLLSTENKK